MDSPLTKLASIAIRNIAEEPNEMNRACILDAAAKIFADEGDALRSEQIATTAAVIREAANAQLQLKSLFS